MSFRRAVRGMEVGVGGCDGGERLDWKATETFLIITAIIIIAIFFPFLITGTLRDADRHSSKLPHPNFSLAAC